MHRWTRNSWSLEGAWKKWARNGSHAHEKWEGTGVSFPVLNTPASGPLLTWLLLFWDWRQDFFLAQMALEVFQGQPPQLPEGRAPTLSSSGLSHVVLCDSLVSMLILTQGLCTSRHRWQCLSQLSSSTGNWLEHGSSGLRKTNTS